MKRKKPRKKQKKIKSSHVWKVERVKRMVCHVKLHQTSNAYDKIALVTLFHEEYFIASYQILSKRNNRALFIFTKRLKSFYIKTFSLSKLHETNFQENIFFFYFFKEERNMYVDKALETQNRYWRNFKISADILFGLHGRKTLKCR